MKRRFLLYFFFLLVGGLLVLPYTTPAQATATTVTATLNFFPSGLTLVDHFDSYLFTITNQTGVTWTDFHFTTLPYIDPNYPGPFPVWAISWFGTDANSTDPYSGPGIAMLSTGQSGKYDILDVAGLNIPDNGQYICTVNVFSSGDHLLSFYPTATGGPGPGPGPGPSVPEPSTMLLLGSGLIGLVGLRRKLK